MCESFFWFCLNGRISVPKLLDSNEDGKVSATEARVGYATAAKGAIAKANYEKPTEKEFEIHGQLGSSAVHKLYLADAFESHLTARLASGIWFRFVGGALTMAVGAVALTGFEGVAIKGEQQAQVVTSSPVKRSVAQAESIESSALFLHKACVDGKGRGLWEVGEYGKRNRFKLSAQNLEDHNCHQACRLGQTSHCTAKIK